MKIKVDNRKITRKEPSTWKPRKTSKKSIDSKKELRRWIPTGVGIKKHETPNYKEKTIPWTLTINDDKQEMTNVKVENYEALEGTPEIER